MSAVRFVHQYVTALRLRGVTYAVRAYGAPWTGATWAGWFVFFPLDGGTPLTTDRETTQSGLEHLTYWAGGISLVYLMGALGRAVERAAGEGFSEPAPYRDGEMEQYAQDQAIAVSTDRARLTPETIPNHPAP